MNLSYSTDHGYINDKKASSPVYFLSSSEIESCIFLKQFSIKYYSLACFILIEIIIFNCIKKQYSIRIFSLL